MRVSVRINPAHPNRPTRVGRRIRQVLAALVSAAAVLATVLVVYPPAAGAISPCSDPLPPPRCSPRPPTPAPKPHAATPTNASVTGVTSHSATLTWSDSAGDENGFLVSRVIWATYGGQAQSSQVSIAASGPGPFGITQTDLPANESVQWTIMATSSTKLTSTGDTVGTLTVDIPATIAGAAQLQAFRADWGATAFPNVSKGAVLADVVRIVDSPDWTIAQGMTGGCGPATVELELVHRDPARFVDTLHSIDDYGSFTTPDGTTYSASSDLRNSPPNTTPDSDGNIITAANWLFMATLKDAINPTARITAATSGDDPAWISLPGDVDNWLSHVVGLHHTTATAIARPFTYGETIMPGATSVLDSGGAVVLLIDASLVGNNPGISTPNHYVDVRSFSWTPTTVTFTVMTWGQLKSITTSWNNFDGLTWDVLTAN